MKGKKLTVKERMERLENDPVFRRSMFKDFLAHIERGMSADCFADLSIESVKDFMSRYPNEFDKDAYQDSCRKAKGMWEDMGYRQGNGECYGNSRSWFYNMANRYGWRDKIEVDAEVKGSLNVNVVNYAASKPSKSTSEQV